MKRAQELTPLSRFHRTVLFTAQNCLANGARFSGYPQKQNDRRAHLVEHWPDIKGHFNFLTEALSNTEEVANVELFHLIKSMNQEQKAILESINRDKRILTEESLNQVGQLLEIHVRNTERKLFQCIQKEDNNSLLHKIGSAVRSKSLYEGLIDIKRT